MRKYNKIKTLEQEVKALKVTSERLEGWLMLLLNHNQIKISDMDAGKWYRPEGIDESK